jgi:hypothetical protein
MVGGASEADLRFAHGDVVVEDLWRQSNRCRLGFGVDACMGEDRVGRRVMYKKMWVGLGVARQSQHRHMWTLDRVHLPHSLSCR